MGPRGQSVIDANKPLILMKIFYVTKRYAQDISAVLPSAKLCVSFD